MSDKCQNLTFLFNQLQTEKPGFDEYFSEGNFAEVKTLKRDIIDTINQIKELTWPFEAIRKEEIEQQYNSMLATYVKYGVVAPLQSGELGINSIEIEGRREKFPIPKLKDIIQFMREKEDILKEKLGPDTKNCLTPIAANLGSSTKETVSGAESFRYTGLMAKYVEALRDHFQQGKLHRKTKDANGDIIREQLVNTQGNKMFSDNWPLWVINSFDDADTKTNGLIYYPDQFRRNETARGGYTKAELIERTKQTHFPGWVVNFYKGDDNTNLVSEDITIQKEPGEIKPSPSEYRSIIGFGAHAYEVGLTMEDWLMRAITYLEETDEAIDDFWGLGKITYLLGCYDVASDHVPRGYWDRNFAQTCLGGISPSDRNGNCAGGTAVSSLVL